jgi:hypothetical protein
VGFLIVLVIVVVIVALVAKAHGSTSSRSDTGARQTQVGPAEVARREQAERDARDGRERAKRDERDRREERALYDELVALETAARNLPNGSPAAPVLAAGLRLALQDRATTTLMAGLHEPIPLPRAFAEPGGDPAQPVEAFYAALQRNAVAVAGVEQLALAGFVSLAGSGGTPEALLNLAGVPAQIAVTADGLVGYLGDPQFDVDLAHAAEETLAHALHHLLPGVEPGGGLDLGLAGDLIRPLVGLGGTVAGAAVSWIGGEALHGVKDFVEQAGQSAMVVDAVSHLDQAADTVAGALGLDGALGHLPVITAAVSGFREVRLLKEGQTTAATAAQNLALDVGGTGGGATIGAIIGGVVGNVVPIVGGAVGAAAGGAVGGMSGRFLSNKIKGRNLRNAEDDLARIHEAYPGRLDAAAAELCEAVATEAAVARAAYEASVGPAPRLTPRYSAEIESMTAQFRSAVGEYLREVDDAVARARGLAAAGRIPAPDLTRTSAALAAAREATAVPGQPGDGPLLLQLCVLAHASPPVASGGRFGTRYRECADRTAAQLDRIAATHAGEVRAWATHAASRFADETGTLATVLDPEVQTYRNRATAAADELNTATQLVLVERGRLGR